MPRQPAVQVRGERLGAALQHLVEIGRLGQRQADRRGERGERPGVVLRLLPGSHFLFERRGAFRPLAHLRGAPQAGHDQKHVFEDDPGRVLYPAPLARDHHAVHRLRPEQAAQHVVERDHDRGRNQHAPVAIEREEGERSEDVEVRLDATAGQVDEQRAHQHLRDGDGVARRQLDRTQASPRSAGKMLTVPPSTTAAHTCR